MTTTTIGRPVTESEDLTVQQVADLLGARPATVRRWLNAGAFPEAWKPTDSAQSNWRIPRTAVDAWRTRGRAGR